MVERKNRPNSWLTDPEFHQRIEFADREYLLEVLRAMWNFVRKCPVPISTHWDNWHKRIDVMLGQYKTWVKLDPNIAPHDLITLIDIDLTQFYPGYVIEGEEQDVDYSADEIADLIKEKKITFDEAFNMKKKARTVETGRILRIWLLQDTFRFLHEVNKNAEDTLRIATQPLSEFLRTLRSIERVEEKKAFIFENSRIIQTEAPKLIPVQYTGIQLENFFKINRKIQPEAFISAIAPGQYEWGKFRVNVASGDQALLEAHMSDRIL